MDEGTLQQVALALREAYPDDDDFAAAMRRLQAALAEGPNDSDTITGNGGE